MDKIYQPGQSVELIILRETDLGFVAQINGHHEGLLYHSELFEKLYKGQELTGHIKKVRPDGGIDLILQAFGSLGAEEMGQRILEVLEKNGGTLSISDKTNPEKIYELFGMSKKKFKIALGGLYKKRRVIILENQIQLSEKK